MLGLLLLIAIVLFVVGALSAHWILIGGIIALAIYFLSGPLHTSNRRWY